MSGLLLLGAGGAGESPPPANAYADASNAVYVGSSGATYVGA